MPITPAVNVLLRAFCPNDASTVLDDISSRFVGNAPELINSTNEVASSFVKLPSMITSLLDNASLTNGEDKQ